MHKPDGPLRVALVAARGWQLTGWQAHLVGLLAADPRFRLVGRLPAAIHVRQRKPGPAVAAVLGAEGWLVNLRFRPPPPEPAQRRVDALPLLKDCAGVDVALALDRGRLRAEDRQRLPQGEVTALVEGRPVGLPGIRVARGDRALGLLRVDVVRQRAEQPVSILRARFNPKPTSLLTADFLAEKAALALQRALADLAQDRPLDETPVPVGAMPRAGDLPGYVAAVCGTVLARLVDRLRGVFGRSSDFWELAAGEGDAETMDPAKATVLPRLSFVMADPFLFQHDTGLHLFYEALGPRDHRATIDVARLEGNSLVPLGTAMKQACHLSFPFVFRDGPDIYMMPETQSNNRLEVWKARDFPLHWDLHATALNGRLAADSCLFRHDGIWWLFTNLSEHHRFQDHSSALYLFATDGPDLGNLRPHPQNPVVIGSDVARNAGAVVRSGGRLFRPAQNNSNGVYGYGLNLMEIEELTMTTYRERPVRQFSAENLPGWRRLHHASFSGARFVVDRTPE